MALIKRYIKDLMKAFKEGNVPILAAAQAYYYLLAIVPLFIVLFAIIPYFQLDPAKVISFLEKTIPAGIASIFEDKIVQLIQTPKNGLLTIGILGTLWSSSSGVNAFIKATNQAYGIEETRPFIKVRLLALGLTISMVLAIVVAMLFVVFGKVILQWIGHFVPMNNSTFALLSVVRWGLSIVVITLLLLGLYHFAPNKKIPFKHILPGAMTTSILWLIISLGFSFYVSNFCNYSATYGSLGGIIILMIWFYLTGLLLMLGAEINVIYHRNKQYEQDDRRLLKKSMLEN